MCMQERSSLDSAVSMQIESGGSAHRSGKGCPKYTVNRLLSGGYRLCYQRVQGVPRRTVLAK